MAGLDRLEGRRRQAEVADLLGIAKAGAGNGDSTPGFSAAAVRVLGRLARARPPQRTIAKARP
jgi:hypothetical protein